MRLIYLIILLLIILTSCTTNQSGRLTEDQNFAMKRCTTDNVDYFICGSPIAFTDGELQFYLRPFEDYGFSDIKILVNNRPCTIELGLPWTPYDERIIYCPIEKKEFEDKLKADLVITFTHPETKKLVTVTETIYTKYYPKMDGNQLQPMHAINT